VSDEAGETSGEDGCSNLRSKAGDGFDRIGSDELFCSRFTGDTAGSTSGTINLGGDVVENLSLARNSSRSNAVGEKSSNASGSNSKDSGDASVGVFILEKVITKKILVLI
jgi:hypothetical protein